MLAASQWAEGSTARASCSRLPPASGLRPLPVRSEGTSASTGVAMRRHPRTRTSVRLNVALPLSRINQAAAAGEKRHPMKPFTALSNNELALIWRRRHV
jgi:hypothetical protein